MTISAPPPLPVRNSPEFYNDVKVFYDWFLSQVQNFNLASLESVIPTFVDGTSFVPTISGSTVAGVGTYTTQNGSYTRIGNRVFFDIYVAWTAHTGTGNLLVTGLPFTHTATQPRSTVMVLYNNITLTAATKGVGRILPGANHITPLQEPSGGGIIANVAMDTAGDISMSGSYAV